MNAEDAIELTNYAAMQNDRWLFIALLIVFLCSMGLLVRWGMAQLAARDARIEALSVAIGQIQKDHAATMMVYVDRFATIVHSNTVATERNTVLLDRLEEHLRKHEG